MKISVGAVVRNLPNPNKNDIIDMLQRVGKVGYGLWQNDWMDSPETAGKVPSTIKFFCNNQGQYKYSLILGINPYKSLQEGGIQMLLDLDSNEHKQLFIQTAIAIASECNPEYLSLGTEVNTIKLFLPNQYDKYVKFYREAYVHIKNRFRNIKVFCTFQLEEMRGLGGAWFPSNLTPQRNVIEPLYDGLDLLVLTSYPEIAFKHPRDIPLNYFDTGKNKAGAISETSWSETGNSLIQVEYIFKLLYMARDKEFINWTMLHDVPVGMLDSPLSGFGLIRTNGTPKHAWNIWNRSKKIIKYQGNIPRQL